MLKKCMCLSQRSQLTVLDILCQSGWRISRCKTESPRVQSHYCAVSSLLIFSLRCKPFQSLVCDHCHCQSINYALILPLLTTNGVCACVLLRCVSMQFFPSFVRVVSGFVILCAFASFNVICFCFLPTWKCPQHRLSSTTTIARLVCNVFDAVLSFVLIPFEIGHNVSDCWNYFHGKS